MKKICNTVVIGQILLLLQILPVRMAMIASAGREIWKLHAVNRKTGYREIQTIFFMTMHFFNSLLDLEYSIIILFSDLWFTSWQQHTNSKNRIAFKSLGRISNKCPVASSIKSNEKRLNNDRSPFSHFPGLSSDCCKLMPLVVHFSK